MDNVLEITSNFRKKILEKTRYISYYMINNRKNKPPGPGSDGYKKGGLADILVGHFFCHHHHIV